MNQQKGLKTAFAIITILFFLWGFITVFVDSLIPRAKEIFELTLFQAGLIQFAFFGAYGLLSIPAGGILAKIGYQRGIVLGLFLLGTGCFLFWPAASVRAFPLFMLAAFVLASGMTFLQVAANPYVSVLGPEKSASSRLILSQAFNSFGAAIAPALGAMFILSDSVKTSDEITVLESTAKEAYYASEASAVSTPFLWLAGVIAVLVVFFAIVKLPKILGQTEATGGFMDALKFPQLKWGALGIFVYVGAEVAIGTYMVNYFMDMNLAEAVKSSETMSGISKWVLGQDLANVDAKGIVGAFILFYWSGAMVGRFIGAFLTKVFKPSLILSVFALGAISMIVISIMTSGFTAMWAILLVGLFNSIMFPTIFTLAIEGLGDFKPQGSGILCTAIVGGAFIPPLFGALSDGTGFKMALILPIICYLYIAWYGRSRGRVIA